MQTEEILQLLSDNHRLLILAGGLICFISVFLPFVDINEMHYGGYVLSGFHSSLSTTWLFWIYLILIGGIFAGYFQGYGEKYPYFFLGIGSILLLMTFYGTQVYAGGINQISVSYGFFLELIGSLAVATGGYFYYEKNNPSTQKSP